MDSTSSSRSPLDAHEIYFCLDEQEKAAQSAVQVVASRTAEIIDTVWDRAARNVTRTLSQTAAVWVKAELLNPLPQVPVLFASVGSSDARDAAWTLDFFEETLEQELPTTVIVRMQQCRSSTRTVEETLQLLDAQVRKKTVGTSTAAQAASASGATTTAGGVIPTELLTRIRTAGVRSLVIVVDDVDALNTSVVFVLAHLARELRAPLGDVHRVPAAIVLGLRISTIDSVRSTWPPGLLSATLSTGATLSNFTEVLNSFRVAHAQETRLAPTIGVPQAVLNTIIDEVQQCVHSVQAAKQRLHLYVATMLSTIPYPHVFVPIWIGPAAALPPDFKPGGAVAVTFRSKPRNSSKLNGTRGGPVLKQALQGIYKALVQKAAVVPPSEMHRAVDALLDRCVGRLILAFVALMHMLRQYAEPGHEELDVLTSMWSQLCDEGGIDTILTDLSQSAMTPAGTTRGGGGAAWRPETWRPIEDCLKILRAGSTEEGGAAAAFHTLEHCLKLIGHQLTTASDPTIKAYFLPVDAMKRARWLAVQLTNPSPAAAIAAMAQRPRLEDPTPLIPAPTLPPAFLDVATLVKLAHLSPERVPLQQWFLTFAEHAATTSSNGACTCVVCLERRFLRAVQASVVLGLITEPKKSGSTKQCPAKEDEEDDGSDGGDMSGAEGGGGSNQRPPRRGGKARDLPPYLKDVEASSAVYRALSRIQCRCLLLV